MDPRVRGDDVSRINPCFLSALGVLAVEKLSARRAAGVTTVDSPALIGKMVKDTLAKRGLLRV